MGYQLRNLPRASGSKSSPSKKAKNRIPGGDSMITWLLHEKKEDSRGGLLNSTLSLRRFPSLGLEKKLILNVFPKLKERSLDTAHNSPLPIYPQRLYKEIHKVF